MRERLMAYKPDYIKEAIAIKRNGEIILKPGEICIINNCPFAKDGGQREDGICPGKKHQRDYRYTCDLAVLTADHKRGAEREAVKFSEILIRLSKKK